MNRREALRQLGIMAGGLMIIPSCDLSRENVLLAYEKLQITEGHQQLLAKVVETILPGGEITGARELNIQDYVLVMANDCLAAENQRRFVAGLKQFGGFVQQKYGSSFEEMPQTKAEEVYMAAVSQQEENPKDKEFNLDEIKYFLGLSKRYTLEGYLSSEYFMTEIMPYEMIPGGFQGEVLIEPQQKLNING